VDYARNSYHDEFIYFHFTFLLVLRLIFLMNLILAHMVLLHERVVSHALIMVFIHRVGMVFPLEVSILTLS
jgi:hypothetical protein